MAEVTLSSSMTIAELIVECRRAWRLPASKDIVIMDPARNATLRANQTLAEAAVTHGTTLVAGYRKGVGRGLVAAIGRLGLTLLGILVGALTLAVPPLLFTALVEESRLNSHLWSRVLFDVCTVLWALPAGYLTVTVSRRRDLSAVIALALVPAVAEAYMFWQILRLGFAPVQLRILITDLFPIIPTLLLGGYLKIPGFRRTALDPSNPVEEHRSEGPEARHLILYAIVALVVIAALIKVYMFSRYTLVGAFISALPAIPTLLLAGYLKVRGFRRRSWKFDN
jgi:hypothetical protein